MELSDLVPPGSCPSIAFVGAGGKTTAMFSLARLAPGRIATAATAHLAVEQQALADSACIVQSPAEVERFFRSALARREHKVALFTGSQGELGRTLGLDAPCIDRLHECCRDAGLPLLIEADGSRCRPLKAPADYEPVIPPWVDAVVVVAGLSGLGRPLTADWVHRPEVFSRLGRLPLARAITPLALVRVLTHPSGGLKGIPPNARRVVLLNQADSPLLERKALHMAAKLTPPYDGVIIARLQKN